MVEDATTKVVVVGGVFVRSGGVAMVCCVGLEGLMFIVLSTLEIHRDSLIPCFWIHTFSLLLYTYLLINYFYRYLVR